MIFIVEDEPVLGRSIVEFLSACGHQVQWFPDAEAALAAARSSPPDVAICDMQLPGMSGLELVSELARVDPSIIRVVLTAHPSVRAAVAAMRSGCYEYLEKPLDLQQLERIVRRALSERRSGTELAWLRRQTVYAATEALLGESQAIRELRAQVQALSRLEASSPPILICGETGVGKGLVARMLHANRFGAEAPFIDVNCAALPASLIEAELFGYERSAFTDAKQAKPGLFEVASGGTIFLDEVAELPMEFQAKLLKVVEGGMVRRIGAVRDRPVSAAIVAATNVDVRAAMASGKLRTDLYHRLAAFTIHVPPLRSRDGDAVLLARAFLAEFSARYHKSLRELSRRTETRIAAYSWPGNVRELRFALERAVFLASPDAAVLDMGEPAALLSPQPPRGGEAEQAAVIAAAAGGIRVMLPEGGVPFAELEKAILAAALEQASGNVVQAARLLDVSRDTVRYRMRKLGLASTKTTSTKTQR